MRLAVFLLFCSLYLVSPLRSSATPLIVTRDPAKPQQGLTVSTATLTSTGRATFVTVTATTGTFGNLVFTTGSLPGTLTAGTGLSGSSYNGSANRTWTADATYIKGLFSATLPITYSAGVIAANSNITALNTYGSYDGNTYYWINPTYYNPGAFDNNAITGTAYSLRMGQGLSITNSGTSTFLGSNITATGNGVNASNRNVAVGNTISMLPRTSTGEMTHNVMLGAQISNAADFGINIGYDNEVLEHAAIAIGTHAFNSGFASGIYGGQWLWNRSGGLYSAILGGLQVSNNGANSSILSSAYVNNGADNNLVFAPNGGTTATLSTANRFYLFPHGSGGMILNGTTPTSGYEVDLQSADLRVNGNALITGTGTIGSTVYPGTYTQGDILYASAANTLAKLAKNTTASRYLSNTGTSNNPAWAQVDVTNGITGAVPIANAGTNITTYAQGDTLYASATNVLSKLTKNSTDGAYLSNLGTSNNPAWTGLGYSHNAIPQDDATFYCRMRGNASGTLPNVVDAVTPTVTGSPAAASVITDGNNRSSIGNCLTFDGSDDRVNWGDICNVTTNDFTVAFWFRNISGTSGNQSIFDKRNSSYTGYSAYMSSSGQIVIEMGTASGTSGGVGSTGYRDSVWRHAVLSFTRSGNCVLYINGVSNGTRSISGASAQNLTNTSGLQWGASRDNSLYFNGQLDECLIFSRALTANEALRLYSVGTILTD